jgi:peptidoglycan/LPS O-acetylase OafA/YrhL
MSERFENVNLLRAFAATAVVVYHVIEYRQWQSFPVDGPLVTFRIGWIGVDLFYVISGFVITWSALALWRQDPARFAGRYWARRLARILPLYLVTCVLWVALFKPDFFDQSMRGWLWQIVSHLTFTHTFSGRTFGSIDGVNWTLAIEMQFYLAVALLVPWLARTPGWRIWLGCIAIAVTWRAAMYVILGPEVQARLFFGVTQLPGVLDEFGAGIFLARIVDRDVGPRPIAGAIRAAAAIVAGTLCLKLYWSYSTYWDVPGMVIFWRTLLGVYFLCVVAAAVNLPAFAEAMPLQPIRYLGVVSYGIYLWHLFAIRYVQSVPEMTSTQALVVALGLTIGLAMLSWHIFERPVLDWGRRFKGDPSRRSSTASADRIGPAR